MQISSVPATVPVSSRLSPVMVWQQLLTYLLEHHYGLTLNDTPFHDDTAIEEHIDAGITLADAVNFLVEKYELARIDRKGFTWREQPPPSLLQRIFCVPKRTSGCCPDLKFF